MSETLIIVQAGSPVVATTGLTFLGTGSEGTFGACRRLVFPAGVSPLLAPIVYSVGPNGACLNPTATLNFDKIPLTKPTINVVKTIGSTRVVRFDEAEEDVVVTEIWSPTGGASMPTSLFRLFKEYLDNAPPFTPAQTDFIVWEPREKTDRTYQVELLGIEVGGQDFNVRDLRTVAGDFDDALTTLNTTPTGLVDEEVRMRMRVVAEVV